MVSTPKRDWSIAPRRRGLLVIILLAITNLATVVLLARTWFDGRVAHEELYGFATYAGAVQAHVHYRNGVLREYELAADWRADETGGHNPDGGRPR